MDSDGTFPQNGEGWWQELLEEIGKFCKKQGVEEAHIPIICSTFREKVISYEYRCFLEDLQGGTV